MSKKIKVLFTDSDREALQPVLEALRAKGLHVSEASGELGKDDVVLAALSEAFYADKNAEDRLLSLIGAGAENVLPLQMDTAPMPDSLKNAIYSRNIIPGTTRTPEQIAERVVAALPQKKSGMPRALLIAGIALLAVVGLLIWRAVQNKAAAPEAPADGITVPVSLGLTEEELAEVRCVTIIGEHFSYFKAEDKEARQDRNSSQWRDMLYELGSDQQIDGTENFDWYWNEDGSRVSMTAYDLRFLSLMPNLEELHMAMVDVEQAPDLSGLEKMSVVWALDCRLDDLSWMARSGAYKLQIRCHTDYAPLAESEALRTAILDVYSDTPTDFSAFSPKNLQEIHLNGHGLDRIDLSGLKACGKLKQVRLGSLPLRDLSFLEDKKVLTLLSLDNMDELRDVSALRSLSGLQWLDISPVDRIADLSPIADCTSLVEILLDTHDGRMRDVSFLGELKNLDSIGLFGVDLQDLGFLEVLGQRNRGIRLALEGDCRDWSGLGAIGIYNGLEISPWDNPNILDDILSSLENTTIREFTLRRFPEVNLAELPRVTDRLELDRCGIEDLSTMPAEWEVHKLNLNKCSSLRSLDGLQNQNTIGNGGDLDVFLCPRLTDWSALDGMKLNQLRITGGFSLPSFENLSLGELHLDSVADVKDLDFLEGLDTDRNCSFALIGMDELWNLAPLSRFHGQSLAVSPQLQEQAEDLVKAGNFREYRIEYPEGGWEMDNMNIALLSLDELDTLPPALLRRVNRLCLAGDQVVDAERFEIWDDWEHRDAHGHPGVILHNRDTGEETPVKTGSITDLSRFSCLTGLHELKIFAQPLASLDGIQAFSELEHLEVCFCYELKDASPAFALQGLRGLQLRNTGVASIQGVQNLTELKNLNVSSTEVSDISPLSGCDFSRAYNEGGLWLGLGGTHIQDFSPLASLRKLETLDVNAYDSAEWLDAVNGVEILRIDGRLDSDEALAELVRRHPELEELHFPWSEQVNDLTPLLQLENLRYIRVSRNMDKAIASLNGQNAQFEMEIEG